MSGNRRMMPEKESPDGVSRVVIVVLGDLGRSPRMQRHALELAERGVPVSLVGHNETPLIPALAEHPQVTLNAIALPRMTARGPGGRLAYLMRGLVQALSQGASLWRAIWGETRGDAFVLVQNPPAIPVLPIVAIIARLRGKSWYLDWHNFGASMLALRLGDDHMVVRLARWIETQSARTAESHFCVSAAMARTLECDWHVAAARVLPDRPLKPPRPLPQSERTALMMRLAHCLPDCLDAVDNGDAIAAAGAVALPEEQFNCSRLGDVPTRVPEEWQQVESTRFSSAPLVVSPSSWSLDDDWPLLLDAAKLVDERILETEEPGRLVILLTGKGPAKPAFEAALAERCYRNLRIATLWLHPDDYRRLLASADLGLSLHKSTSGVDLPMKVIDMFEAGLPAAVLRYGDCIDEMIREGEDVITFVDAKSLADLLFSLFFTEEGKTLLTRMRSQVAVGEIWHEAWGRVAAPVLTPGLN